MTWLGEPTEEAALQTDIYLEALLGRILTPEDPVPDPRLRATARLLRQRLVRFHPSFRFEESLAARLRAGATRTDVSHEPIPFPIMAVGDAATPAAAAGVDRRLLLGGAIASGVSIAGAALFAWRRTRPVLPPFARAARAAHRRRTPTAPPMGGTPA